MYFVISLGSVNGQRVLKYKYEFCSTNDMSRSAIVALVVDDIVVAASTTTTIIFIIWILGT